jgi:hypothetical protein
VASRCGGGVIEWEEALDAQFLERDVLWCAEHRDRREEVEPLVAVPEAHRHDRNQRCPKIRRTPPGRHARVVEHFGQERASRLIERTANRFTMHAANRGLCHRLPVVDEGPQAFRVEHEAEDVAGTLRRPPVEQHPEETRRGTVVRQDLPVPVHNHRRIGFLLFQDGMNRGPHWRELTLVECGLPKHRRETGGEEQRVALS